MLQRQDLEGFFPAGIEFELQPVRMPGADETTAAERACVARAVAKRQREFLSGRAAARLALGRLGCAPGDLLVSPARSPIWPPEAVGSISHDDSHCLVAVALRARWSSIGVDCEPDAALEETLWDRICTPAELGWIRAQPEDLRGRWVRRHFSAKEAAFKFQHPLTQAFLGFQDLEVRFDPHSESFTMHADPRVSGADAPGGASLLPAPLLQAARGACRRRAGRLASLVTGRAD